ncbi:hypothetical protein [Methylobacterium isbiliense]|jgi:quercetin dioxygenase-like cupin family protein|uniref:Cupin 2 conserved barrel domain-containing protein n=1 Tax=Methylobacterium isbiliense TaxID=315478 RepID=A0ABQ4SMQ8_9HYPH|nr:hypothetical protein [Methylobacterium isbiliense]MDN3626690.1 hypothetical protein [Methylobacterium isbiliense]GJE03805.1 hypothetical protein GMJLKIPL_5762 [Methylobacterium isbiliense]
MPHAAPQARTHESPAHEAAPPDLAEAFARARHNGCVGTRLLSETERVRVWTIELKPGERIDLHTHVLDYFWTAVTPGRARSRYADGRVAEVAYAAGDISHQTYGPGQHMTHDLENIGDTTLIFTTVEFLGGANPPLPLPEAVRAEAAPAPSRS